MNEEMREWIMAQFRAVRRDPRYAALSVEYEKLHDQFAVIADSLPEEEQDILWAFVTVSEEMNWRMLEWLRKKYTL